MASEGASTTIELHELFGRVEQSLAVEALRLKGECRNAFVSQGFVAFDLCTLRKGVPHLVRVTISQADLPRVRRAVEGAARRSLGECLCDGRVVTVVGNMGQNDATLEFRARMLFIDDLNAVGTVHNFLDALPRMLRSRGIEPDRLDGTKKDGRLSVARPLKHVTVLTASKSKGFTDFDRALDRALAGQARAPKVHKVDCKMQGPAAVSTIVEALADIDPTMTDAVCIVRGGGAWPDLWSFQSMELVKAIQERVKTVPVYTGIGHSEDRFAIDCAATEACDTPTDLGMKLGRAIRHKTSSRYASSRPRRAEGTAKPAAVVRASDELAAELAATSTRLGEARARVGETEAELDRVKSELLANARRAFVEGQHLGERVAVHRAIGIAVIAAIASALLVGALGVATDQFVFVLVGLAAAGVAGALTVRWARTAP